MGGIVKKVAKTVNKLDPLGKIADKGLNALGLPTATDIGNMLDPEKPDLPDTPATTTPQQETDNAAQQAALAANAKAAELARQRRAGSVLAGGAPAGSATTSSVLAYGKARLGD